MHCLIEARGAYAVCKGNYVGHGNTMQVPVHVLVTGIKEFFGWGPQTR